MRVRLNVRGICALRPGVPGVSDRIEVVSVVDRFLEHARVYAFLNGGDDEVYLASADWMPRNLDKRIELMFPVREPEQRARVLHALRAMFRDTVKSRWLGADGVWTRRVAGEGEETFRVQAVLYEDARKTAGAGRDASGFVIAPEDAGRGRATRGRPPR